MDWKAPTSVHEVRSFQGLAGYYHRFILDFSKIAQPKTRLLQKDEKFRWTPECEAAFHTLRTLLTTTPILAQPDIEKPFDETKHFRLDERSVIWFEDQLVVPKDRELRNQILDKAHSSKLSIHPGSSKMYQDLKTYFLVDQDEERDLRLCR